MKFNSVVGAQEVVLCVKDAKWLKLTVKGKKWRVVWNKDIL